MICSRTLQIMLVKDIYLWLAADDFLRFLKIGVTCSLHQSAGSLPVWRERSKIICIIGALSSQSSLSKSGLSLSGLAALKGFRF